MTGEEKYARMLARVAAERQAIMQRHIDELRSGIIGRTLLKVGDHAPAIVPRNAKVLPKKFLKQKSV